MNWKKLIPGRIKITSLYWVEKEEILDKDLSLLFRFIDEDSYSTARGILKAIRDDWHEELHHAPTEFSMKYYGETTRAEAMLDFLETPLD